MYVVTSLNPLEFYPEGPEYVNKGDLIVRAVNPDKHKILRIDEVLSIQLEPYISAETKLKKFVINDHYYE